MIYKSLENEKKERKKERKKKMKSKDNMGFIKPFINIIFFFVKNSKKKEREQRGIERWKRLPYIILFDLIPRGVFGVLGPGVYTTGSKCCVRLVGVSIGCL